MPESPMPESAEGEGGGSMSEALQSTDQMLSQITQAVTQNGQVPDEAKQAFTAALQAYRQGLEIILGAAGGGQANQPTTPEQGASGAQPESMARPK